MGSFDALRLLRTPFDLLIAALSARHEQAFRKHGFRNARRMVEAGRIELPSKTVGPSVKPRASPLYLSRHRSLPGPPERLSSSVYLAELPTNRRSLGDSDLVRPELLPTDSGGADPRSIKPRKRRCYSQLLFLPLFTRPTAPRLATESRSGSVEP